MVSLITSEIIQYSFVNIIKNYKEVAKYFIKLSLEASEEYYNSRRRHQSNPA